VEVAPDDGNMIPYYAEVWPAALGLATWMEQKPSLWHGARVLELGCGLGLPALVAAKLGAHVTATDYHPDNARFFQKNVLANGLSHIDYFRMDWRRPAVNSIFDIVIGSDLIYEREMITPLASCLAEICAPGSIALLADPGRPHLQEGCSQIEKVGFDATIEVASDTFVVRFDRT